MEDRPEIRTPRLRLRPNRLEDVPRLVDLINDIEVMRMLARVPYPYDLTDARAFLSGRFDRKNRPGCDFAVEHPEFGLIGGIGVHYAEDPWPELGFWLGRTFWNRGFGREAAQAVAAWSGEAWGRPVLGAGYFADNPASAAVLSHAGFLPTGEVRPRFSSARGVEAPTRMMIRLA